MTDQACFSDATRKSRDAHHDPVEQLTTRSNLLPPIGEVTAFLLLAFLLQFLGIIDLSASQPHPFWALIIWAGLRYQPVAAMAATTITICVYFTDILPTLGDARSDLVAAGVLPLLWLASAIGLVQAKSFFYLALHGTQQKFVELGRSFETLASHAETTAQRAHQLELASRRQSQALVTMLQSIRLLAAKDDETMLKGIRLLVHGMLSPTKFSLFLLEDDVLSIADKSGWAPHDTYHSEITTDSLLFTAIVRDRKLLCVAEEKSAHLLERQGLLAAPLVNGRNGQVIGMLKIEEISFDAFDQVAVEMFRLLSEEISVILSDKHIESQTTESVNPSTSFEGPSAEEFVSQLGQRLGFGSSRMIVQLSAPNGIAERLRPDITEIVQTSLSATLRQTDVALEFEPKSWSFSVLLAGTSEGQSHEVSKRVLNQLAGKLRALSPNIETTISIFPLISQTNARRTKAA